MPLNNEYKRYFIILQEDDKGYEMAAGKIPTGYAKIEIKNGKGKLTAYAQNVKYGEKVDYRMLLIAPTKKAAVDMGRLVVDSSGRGELNVEFDADNVMKSGMSISDFMVAAVQTSTSIPLSGYTGRDKIQWKNSYHIVNKSHDRIDQMQQPIQEIPAPIQQAPIEMPQLPEVNLGDMVEGAKNIVGNVIESAKDVVEDFVGDVVEGAKDMVEDVAEGAKDIVGSVKKGVKDVIEYVVEDDDVIPMPVTPPPMQPIIEPAPIKSIKETIPIQTVTEPVTMQPVTPITPTKPKKEPVPIQTVTGPITMQPITPPAPVIPKKEQIPIPIVTEPIEMEPVTAPEPEPIPMPEPEPILEPAPVQPIIIMPQKPLFEAETEIKAKFVIETEEKHEHPHYVYKVECPKIDYKDYYYDEESERDSDCDSDSDSDSDDREKDKHHEHHEHHDDDDDSDKDCDKNPYYASQMYRRLEKVLGRLREYEPFNDDDSREKWFKVEDDIYLLNNATIPFMGSIMPLGYPFMSNECVMMIGRKDYIIGVKYSKERKDKKYIKTIMFGIPGMNNKHEERYYSMRGYTDFRPHKSKNYGYWVMTVDIMTGEIMSK